MINQAAAKRYWSGHDPVGAYGRFGIRPGTRFQVVGVVGDVKNDGLAQSDGAGNLYAERHPQRSRRCTSSCARREPPASLVPDIRRAIRAVDPEQPIHDVATMREIIRRNDDARARRRRS